jgi:hypothetical protein
MPIPIPVSISPMDFQNEQARQLAEKHRIEQALNYSLYMMHRYIKDCIDMKLGSANEADYRVWSTKLNDAESGRQALVSAMRRLNKEYGMDFDLSAEA